MMKRLLSLFLALVCALCLAGCRYAETVRVDYDEEGLYTGGDIHITLTHIAPSLETVSFRIENSSEHELSYGQPFFSFSRKTPGGWKRIEADPNWAYTMEGYTLAPGKSVELTVSTERYLVGIHDGKTYRACFEFFYFTDNPEADGSGNFQPTMHSAYLTYDFRLADVVA